MLVACSCIEGGIRVAIGTPLLTTERLILRRFTVNDEDALYQLNANSGVMQFLSLTFPTRDETSDEHQGYIEQYEREPAIGRFAA